MMTFHRRSEAGDVAREFADKIKDKVVLITGVTMSGIGFATAKAMAENKPRRLVLVGRSQSKLDEARNALLEAAPGIDVELVVIDLSSTQSCRVGVTAIKALETPIDVFIGNAAVMDCPQGLTDEGYDLQLATNHLSHFILVEGLLSDILKSEGKTVVLVSSIGHMSGPVNWDDPNWETTPWVTEKAYGSSKSAMTLYARALAKQYGPKGLRAFSLHPGGIETPLQKHWSFEKKMALREAYDCFNEDGTVKFTDEGPWKTLSQGASTTIRAAFDHSLAPNGGYLDDCVMAEEKCNDWAKDPALVERIVPWTRDLLERRSSS